MNCRCVSDASFSSDSKLIHADGPAAEKLRILKPTVLVLGVAKSLTTADRRCRRVAIAVVTVTGVSSDVREIAYTEASWCRHL